MQKHDVNRKLEFELIGDIIELLDGKEIRPLLKAVWKGTNGSKKAVAIGINPSTARTGQSDKTVTTLVRFLDAYECTEVSMINLYEHVSTDQKKLDKSTATDFQKHRELFDAADIVVVVWGMDTKAYDEQKKKAYMALERYRDKLYCMHTSDGRFPAHPSRMRYDYSLMEYKIYE